MHNAFFVVLPNRNRTLHNWHFPFSLNPLLIGNANCAIYGNWHALPLSQLALCTMPFVWYCLPETAHRTIGIFHFHSTHYWFAMPIVQSTLTGMHYHYHNWHCEQCLFCGIACQKTHIAQLALDIFTQTTIDCQCQLCNLRKPISSTAYLALSTMPFMQYCLWVHADCKNGIVLSSWH